MATTCPVCCTPHCTAQCTLLNIVVTDTGHLTLQDKSEPQLQALPTPGRGSGRSGRGWNAAARGGCRAAPAGGAARAIANKSAWPLGYHVVPGAVQVVCHPGRSWLLFPGVTGNRADGILGRPG